MYMYYYHTLTSFAWGKQLQQCLLGWEQLSTVACKQSQQLLPLPGMMTFHSVTPTERRTSNAHLPITHFQHIWMERGKTTEMRSHRNTNKEVVEAEVEGERYRAIGSAGEGVVTE